jgi:hypothetical protein
MSHVTHANRCLLSLCDYVSNVCMFDSSTCVSAYMPKKMFIVFIWLFWRCLYVYMIVFIQCLYLKYVYMIRYVKHAAWKCIWYDIKCKRLNLLVNNRFGASVQLYVCVCVCVFWRTLHKCAYVSVCLFVFACMCAHVCACGCMGGWLCACMHACLCVRLFDFYTYTCTFSSLW